MKFLLPFFCWLLPAIAIPQAKDSVKTKAIANSATDKQALKPEIFTSGFIDIINNGQVNALARFIRLFIGEPGKLAIPLSLYSGVSAKSFQNHSFF